MLLYEPECNSLFRKQLRGSLPRTVLEQIVPADRQSNNNFFPNNKLRSHDSIGMVLASKGIVEMRGVLRKMGKKILVVDDANFMRTIVKDTLAPNGFEIVGEATNGSEAWRSTPS